MTVFQLLDSQGFAGVQDLCPEDLEWLEQKPVEQLLESLFESRKSIECSTSSNTDVIRVRDSLLRQQKVLKQLRAEHLEASISVSFLSRNHHNNICLGSTVVYE